MFRMPGVIMITDDMIIRFESKFNKHVGLDKCWEWEGVKHDRGYGYFHTSPRYSKRKMDYAHRFSFHLYNGTRPLEDEEVCHMCDNPSCVNPNHLFLGTHKDNMGDMKDKGRSHTRWKLTEQDVIDIIEMRIQGYSVKEIAEEFGIDRGYCSRVSRGLTGC